MPFQIAELHSGEEVEEFEELLLGERRGEDDVEPVADARLVALSEKEVHDAVGRTRGVAGRGSPRHPRYSGDVPDGIPEGVSSEFHRFWLRDDRF